jgi:hypothetical protein
VAHVIGALREPTATAGEVLEARDAAALAYDAAKATARFAKAKQAHQTGLCQRLKARLRIGRPPQCAQDFFHALPGGACLKSSH